MFIRRLIISILCIFIVFGLSASGKQSKSPLMPDFAYPQTVEKNADRDLSAALAKKDWKGAAIASVKSITAANLISKENVVHGLVRLDSICRIAPEEWKPAFLLMQADIYRQIYEENGGGSRDLPLDSFPANPYTWSRDLFTLKLTGICSEIMDISYGSKIPVSIWKGFLTNTEYAEKIGMSVEEFLCLRSAFLLDDMADSDGGIIPFFKDIPKVSTPSAQCAAIRRQAIDRLIALAATNPDQSALLADAYVLIDSTLPMYARLSGLTAHLDSMKGTEGEQTLLHRLCSYRDNGSYPPGDFPFSKWQFADMLEKSIHRFPKGPYSNSLRNTLNQLTEPVIDISTEQRHLSSDSIRTFVSMKNCDDSWLLVYDYSPFCNIEKNPSTADIKAKSKLIAKIRIKGSGARNDTAFYTNLGCFTPGSYVVLPSSSPSSAGIYKSLDKKSWNYTFLVSDISYYTMCCPDNVSRVFIVDGMNGRPLEGAKVTVYKRKRWNSPKAKLFTRATNKDGFVEVSEGDFEFTAEYNGSTCENITQINYYYRSDSSSTERYKVSFFNDRSIYHPGDSIESAVVAYSTKGIGMDLCPGMRLKIKMRNASFAVIDSVAATLDKDSRASFKFLIPDSGMRGRWVLSSYLEDGTSCGSEYFNVEDYVAPSFFITTDTKSSEISLGATAKISGSVITYSGMPVTGAEVKYHVSYHNFARWHSYISAEYNGSVTTDGEGRYLIELPTENLRHTVFENGVFNVTISATSASGETQSAPSCSFCIGRDFNIRPAVEKAVCEISDGMPVLKFNVTNAIGDNVEKELKFTVSDYSGKTVASGTFMSPGLHLPQQDWISAAYSIDVTLADDKDVDANMDLILWRKSDKTAPCGVALWVPSKKIIADYGQASVPVTVGFGVQDRWIPAVLSGPDSLISVKWLHVDRDNLTVDVPVPPSGTHYELNLNSISNLKYEGKTVNVYPFDYESKLQVTTVSFRNRLTAGDAERWSFRFTDGEIPASFVPVMAVMTDKSLNAIRNLSWNFEPHPYFIPSYFSLQGSYNYQNKVLFSLGSTKHLRIAPPSYPAINDYNRAWGIGFFMRYDAITELSASSDEYVVAGYGTVKRSRVASMNMAMKAAPTAYAYDEDMEMAEEEQDDDGAEIFASVEVASDDSNTGSSPSDASDLREAEHPVAFFMPLLSTDEDGIVTLDFNVPNFNTTWALQVLGYDKKLQTAKIALEAVASKPVMVRLTAPRFLRTGDEATLTATLFNNSGISCPVGGTVELVDPITGKLIASTDFTAEELPSSGNRVVTMSWTVPSGISQVALRAYAEGASHRDGEQVMVPVLPASSPVVESIPFWIYPGKSKFEVKLPKFNDSDQITLQYCDNPVWYCVSALPDITVPESVSIISKMRALYGNMVAHHLISSNPTLRTGLEFMLSDQNSEFAALKSNLQKDGNLKIVDIDNTPWVNSAESETLRMSRLSTLLEDSVANATVNALLTEIRERQLPSGGWAWCPDMEVSSWITCQVVRNFSMIARSGALDLSAADMDMISKAVAYIDSHEVENYRKYHKKSDSLSYLLDWLYIRSSLPGSVLNTGKDAKAFSEMAAKAIPDIEDSWKNLSVDAKAMAAVLLWRSGRQKTASLILESLRQFASESPEKGAWFDNLESRQYGFSAILTTARVLEAYAEIQPQNPIIDKLRQYLVLSRQTQNWGKSTYTADVVNAILTSGSDWTVTSDLPSFRLGGKDIDVPKAAAMTGAFTVSLDPKKASDSTFKIERNASSQAWGGIVAQYEAPLSEIKETDVPDLSISKQIVAMVPAADGALLPSDDTTLRSGMKVRVTLSIDASRDMDYVAVSDERSACLEPASQLSSYTYSDGLGFYREVRNEATNLFFSRLPKGHYVVSYDCWVTLPGSYSCGIATAQSQYAPTEVAHSAPVFLTVE